MALFGHGRRSGRGRADLQVARFWSAWPGIRDDVASAVDRQDDAAVQALLRPRAREVHPELTVAAGPGVQARHMLVLSGGRRPELRPVTERWRRAGPADDVDWEFHPARPAEPAAFSAPVLIDDRQIDPAEAVALIQADDQRCRLDLSVHHPVFVDLTEAGRRRVAKILVGWALGEDETDRWIGRIEAVTGRPLDSVPVSMLGAVTAQLTDRWGGERWSMLEGSFGTRRLIAAVRHPLHRVDFPLLDQHIAVRLPYVDSFPDGLPSERALGDLFAFEELLVSRLGDAALLVAQQTTSGERLLHLYADSQDSPEAAIRAMLGGYVGPSASLQTQYDPGWESIDHLRG